MDKTKFHGTIVITVLLFFILLVASILFYRERMLFVDPCFVTFTILNTSELVITEHRYGAFITQLFPWIGGMLHLPLTTLLILYSASFYLFFSTIILLLIYRFKQLGLALLMAFYFTLFVSDVYFWPNNEVHQGIAWMFLFFGIILGIKKDTPAIWFYPAALVTAFLAIFSHFIIFLPFAFLWIYFILEKKRWHTSRPITIGFSVVLAVLFFIKYQLGIEGWYDGEKLKGVTTLNFNSVLQSFSSGHAATMGWNILTNYWLIIPIVLLGIFVLIQEKKPLLVGFTLISMMGYFVLVSITFPDAFGRELLFYMESQWMALSIIAATPFVFHVIPQLSTKTVSIVLIFIFAIRLSYITHSGIFFHKRVEMLEAAVDHAKEQGIHKAFVRIDEQLNRTFLMTWGLPVESLTLSTMKGYDPPVTIKALTDAELITTAKDTFLSSFTKMNVRELNRFYFHPDTTTVYQPLDLSKILLQSPNSLKGE